MVETCVGRYCIAVGYCTVSVCLVGSFQFGPSLGPGMRGHFSQLAGETIALTLSVLPKSSLSLGGAVVQLFCRIVSCRW